LKTTQHGKSIWLAIGAAALYGLGAPVAKGLLLNMHPVLLAAMLYLGAGIGMAVYKMVKKPRGSRLRIWKPSDRRYIVLMIALDVIAPIFLLWGLTLTTAANASLLNNFEIVATTLIAALFFQEAIGKKTLLAIVIIALGSVLLSLEDASAFVFSTGSGLVLLAAAAWGLENNCTRKLSHGDPADVVILKGFGSGFTSLILALVLGFGNASPLAWLGGLTLGFVAYGLSILFYVTAQRQLGAAKTSAYYAVAPFIGAALSFVLWREVLPVWYFPALALMAVGTGFAVSDQFQSKTSISQS
jgi:drug/metabolite transporter (DMT)-like permease